MSAQDTPRGNTRWILYLTCFPLATSQKQDNLISSCNSKRFFLEVKKFIGYCINCFIVHFIQ